jgi:hypothetical protein
MAVEVGGGDPRGVGDIGMTSQRLTGEDFAAPHSSK